MTRAQFRKVRGYSPLLWDSGTENGNMQLRLRQKQMWPPEQPKVFFLPPSRPHPDQPWACLLV